MDSPGNFKSLSDSQEDDTQKHLQLEAVGSTRATTFPNADVSVIPPCLVIVNASRAEPVATSGNMDIPRLTNLYGYPSSGILHYSCTSPATHISVPNGRSFPVKVPSSPGTGLHLPCILNTQFPDDCKGVLGEVPLSVDAYGLSDSSSSYQSPVDTEAPLLSCPLPLNHIYVNQNDTKSMGKKNSTASVQANGFTESAQISASNKMQGKKSIGKGDSQRCSCKKSSCLKLYCECFASGSFCGESCRCQDCYNKREDEDMVIELKEQIKSRMPHAFAPKIIQPVTIIRNISGDGRNMITTSGRHRVGCSCRKSLCMKNYCECFKARVGCSSVCRCEGCKNAFGVKDACAEIGEMEGESETVKVRSAMTKPEQCHTGFSPLTPSIESSIPNMPSPSAASGTSVLSSYTDSWNFVVDSWSRTSFPKAGKGTPPVSSNYQAAGSHDAENFGSFLPLQDNFAGGIVFSSSSNCELLQMNLFQGSDHLSVYSPPLTGERINELELDSSSRPCNNLEHNYEIPKDSSSLVEAMKTSSPKQESSSPSHENIPGCSRTCHPDQAVEDAHQSHAAASLLNCSKQHDA